MRIFAGLVVVVMLVVNYSLAFPQVEPVPVVQAVRDWQDALRIYIMPAVGALLMGVVAILLEKIRKVMLQTSARVLVAGAQAANAADQAVAGRQLLAEEALKHYTMLQTMKDQGDKTLEHMAAINGGVSKAQADLETVKNRLVALEAKP